MKNKEKDNDELVLKVKISPISGAGIARVHNSVLKKGYFEEGKPHMVQFGEKSRVMRLVADDFMEIGIISIRKKDIEKLGVNEGEEVTLLPAMNVGERLTRGLSLFRKKKGDE